MFIVDVIDNDAGIMCMYSIFDFGLVDGSNF